MYLCRVRILPASVVDPMNTFSVTTFLVLHTYLGVLFSTYQVTDTGVFQLAILKPGTDFPPGAPYGEVLSIWRVISKPF